MGGIFTLSLINPLHYFYCSMMNFALCKTPRASSVQSIQRHLMDTHGLHCFFHYFDSLLPLILQLFGEILQFFISSNAVLTLCAFAYLIILRFWSVLWLTSIRVAIKFCNHNVKRCPNQKLLNCGYIAMLFVTSNQSNKYSDCFGVGVSLV